MHEGKLILQLKQGSKDAFTVLYRRYWKEVYNFTRLYLNSIADSEEVVQEVFVKVWDMHPTLNEKESFQGYLFIITRNLIFNKNRRSFNEAFFDYTVLNAISETTKIEEEIDVKILTEYINRLVNQLTPRQKEIFELSRNEYLSYKQIAKRLDITEKTVERHINEALKHIRKNMPPLVIFLLILYLIKRN